MRRWGDRDGRGAQLLRHVNQFRNRIGFHDAATDEDSRLFGLRQGVLQFTQEIFQCRFIGMY